MGIEKDVRNPRRGGEDIRKLLLEREAKWMFTLGTHMPLGVNIRQDLRYQFKLCSIVSLSYLTCVYITGLLGSLYVHLLSLVQDCI